MTSKRKRRRIQGRIQKRLQSITTRMTDDEAATARRTGRVVGLSLSATMRDALEVYAERADVIRSGDPDATRAQIRRAIRAGVNQVIEAASEPSGAAQTSDEHQPA